MKNKGFGGDVNPNWSFPKDTCFKNHKWGKRLYENEKLKKIKNKKKKSYFKKFESPWKRKIDLIEISSDEENDDDEKNDDEENDDNGNDNNDNEKDDNKDDNDGNENGKDRNYDNNGNDNDGDGNNDNDKNMFALSFSKKGKYSEERDLLKKP